MNGQLSEQPLAELIRELSEKKLSGGLRVQHKHSKLVVYFENGIVTYAASNIRALRLSEYLKQRQLVKEQELVALNDRQSDLSLAAALTEKGIVSQEEIERELKKLSTDALRLGLLWADGSWQFDARSRLNDAIRLQIDTRSLMLECARKAGLNRIASRFPDPNETISPATSLVSFAGLLPNEGFLLSRVEADINLSDLVALSGLPEPDALRTIYGLTLGGFLNRQKWPIAFEVAKRESPKATVPEPVSAETKTIKAAEEDGLDKFLHRLDVAESHYEVLNVSSDIPSADVKQVYYGMARRYHPDRFRGIPDKSLHARIESAFAKITYAYETLTDPSRRAAYDAKLAAKQKAKLFAESAPKASAASSRRSQEPSGATKHDEAEQAENSFREGFAALQQGQVISALGLLGAAARAVPNEARYRAYYGKALAGHEKTRRSAEAELQAAIKLEPANAEYRVMLADLFESLGFAKRAVAELERALAVDPVNAAARERLRNLR